VSYWLSRLISILCTQKGPLTTYSKIATHKKRKGCPVTCQADNEGSGDTALTILNSCARLGWVVCPSSPSLYPRERSPLHSLQEVGCTWGPVWMYSENLAPFRVRNLNRATHSESSNRQHYPEPELPMLYFSFTKYVGK